MRGVSKASKKGYLQSAHIAVAATTNRHRNLVRNTQPVVNKLRSRVHNNRSALRVSKLVTSALVNNKGARRNRSSNSMRVIRQILRVVDEGPQGIVRPPPRAALAVLERLVLPAQPVVPVRA